MAEQIYGVHINLDDNQIQNAVVHPLGTAPTASEGKIYYDSSAGDKRGYIYDGTAWTPFGWANKAYGQITLGTTTNPGDTWSLNATAITGQTELVSGLVDTDEILVNDGGVLKRTDLSVLKTYINASAGTFSNFTITGDTGSEIVDDGETVTFAGGNGLVTAVTEASAVNVDPYTVTYSLDFTTLTDMTGAVAGTTEIILNDVVGGNIESRKAISEIDLSFFDNTLSGFTTNTGTVTSVAISGTDGIDVDSGSPITGAGTITLGLSNIANSALANATAYSLKGNPTTPAGAPSDITLSANSLLLRQAGNIVDHTIAANTVLGRLGTNIENIAIIDDDTMGTATASNLATSESIVAYVASQIIGGMKYKGAFDPTAGAGAGSPDLDTITSETGDTYTVTVAGTYSFTTGDPVVLEIGDMLIAESDGVLNNVASWTIVNRNIENTIDSYSEVIGDTTTTSFAITHGLNNIDTLVRVVDDTTGAHVMCETINTSASQVTVNFNVAPGTNEYRVIVQG